MTTPQNILQAAALRYSADGFAILPVNSKKRPNISAWTHYQQNKPTEDELRRWFDGSEPETTGLAILAGKVSGNVEVLDVDCKYDLTGTLMKDFIELVKEHLPELFPKLVIAKTVNKGFHVLARVPSESLQGNKKLASRPATTEEAASGDKVKVLIETRGDGGIFVVSPTKDYEWVQGTPKEIPLITAEERETLLTIARSFDQMPVNPSPEEKTGSHTSSSGDLSPFDDYNARAEVPALLEAHGWKRVYQRGEKIFYKRPGTTDSVTSANFHTGLRVFFVFSTSTEFESGRGFNPTQVYAQLEHGGDYSAASKALYRDGYGSRRVAKVHQNFPDGKFQTSEASRQPTPLPEEVFVVPELDESLLPEDWREWLTDIAERMQCPLDYPTIAAIVSAAALVGNKVRIRPKQFDIWQVTPNLWGAVVGMPSLLKSPAVNEGLFFFREIADAERIKYESELKVAEFDKEFAEAKQNEIRKEMKKPGANKETLRSQFDQLGVDEPKEKRLWTADATVESLGEKLNENENGLLLNRDELTGWYRSLDRAGREQDRSFYLECWDGAGSFTFDRIGRGKIHIKNLTLSILGTIQPAMLAPYLRGSIEGYGDDGLVQRFQMLVYPNKPKTYRFIDRIPKGRDKARASFKGLHGLDPKAIGAKQLADEFGGGYFVQFDAEAQEFFQEWLTDLENSLRFDTFDTPALGAHLAKYRSLMPSLALIFHLLDCVSNNATTADVSLGNARKAAAWCSYLQAHAERIYQIVTLSEFDIAREILKKIESKQLGAEFTARDIYGKHWSKLSKPNEVREGLDILVGYGYLSAVTINEGHRPKTVYLVQSEGK